MSIARHMNMTMILSNIREVYKVVNKNKIQKEKINIYK